MIHMAYAVAVCVRVGGWYWVTGVGVVHVGIGSRHKGCRRGRYVYTCGERYMVGKGMTLTSKTYLIFLKW